MSLRDDIETEIRNEIIALFRSGKYDMEFCLEDEHENCCDACKDLLNRLTEIALRYAGFNTTNMKEWIEKRAKELELGKVRD